MIKKYLIIALGIITNCWAAPAITPNNLSMTTELSALSSKNKTYNLMFNLEQDVATYNTTKGTGIDYVKKMLVTCNTYKAKCNIIVVIHGNAFPMLAKQSAISSKFLNKTVNYDYSNDIKYIIDNGVVVVTSKDGLNKFNLKETDLLPQVLVADSATLYSASKAEQGFYVIND